MACFKNKIRQHFILKVLPDKKTTVVRKLKGHLLCKSVEQTAVS